MAKFIIKGGNSLSGKVEIGGMKNAATPILAATLLTDEECIIDNLPRIKDVENLIKILENLGSKIEWLGEHKLKIKNNQISPVSIDKGLVQSMRSSILLLGPLLSRFKTVNIPEPGGCIIGNRPIDTHLYALAELGAEIEKKGNNYLLKADKLIGKKIVLPEFSVTATENLIMAAVLAQGTTEIHLAAAEPHVQDLCHFLNRQGAKIRGIGTHTLIIDGVKKLRGVEHSLIPDFIEAGTYAVAAILTKGKVRIEKIVPEHLDIVLLKMSQIGVNFQVGKDYLEVGDSFSLKSFRLQTMPYPGFPTDLQAPFGLLATQCEGTTLIQETLFEGRFGYLRELIKMGANAIVADPHRVIINGPVPLYGREIKSFDLRAGATLIIAGLIAQGETIINEAEIVDRGYEKIEKKLALLGAKIERIE